MRNSSKSVRIFVFVLLAIVAITTVGPIIYMFMVTFLTKEQYMVNMFTLPTSFNLHNYDVVMQNFDFVRMATNSVIVSASTVVLLLCVTSLTAYSLNKLEWRGKKPVMALITLGMFMPGQVLILPVYQILISLNLVNSRVGLIAFYVAIGIPFTTMMLLANIKGISNEIIESAKIDGAGHFRIYIHMMLPLLKPTLVTAAILNFISNWNELLYAMILMQDEKLRTITVSVVSMANKFASNTPQMYTGLLLSALPVIVAYFFAQKHLIKGVSAGAIK